MKINSIYISAFGTLKDFSLDLSDGLNVVFGENENGKTTVMSFIKAMFYGTGNKRRGKMSVREKYTPWQGGIMGGRINFTHLGVTYLLEREFKNNDSSDRVTLINKDTGKTEDCEKNIGARFFGICEEAFSRSVFIDNDTVFLYDDAAGSDLNAKLSNVSFTGDTEISENTVLKNLTGTKNKMLSKTGKAGTLVQKLNGYKVLEEKLKVSEIEAKEKTELAKRLENRLKELKVAEINQQKVKKITDSENDIKNSQKIKSYIEKSEELKKINETLKMSDNTTVNQMFLNTVTMGLSNYDKFTAKCKDTESEIETLNSSVQKANETSKKELSKRSEELKDKIKGLEEKSTSLSGLIFEKTAEYEAENSKKVKKTKPVNIVLYVLSILLLACVFINYIPAAIGAVLLIVNIILNIKNPTENKKAEKINEELTNLRGQKAEISEKAAKAISELSTITSELNADSAVLEHKLSEIKAKKDILSQYNEKAEKAKAEVLLYFSKYKQTESIEEIKEILKSFEEPLDKAKEIKVQLSVLSADIGNLTLEEAKEKAKKLNQNTYSDIDFEAEKEKAEELNSEITALKEEITEIETTLKTGFRDFIPPITLSRQIDEQKQELQTEIEFCKAVDIAAEVLTDSAAQMRKSYGSVLEKVTGENFSRLTSGTYKTVNVSNQLDISAEQSDIFGMRNYEFLSKGTVDQAYLSLRLAISSLLSNEEPLPVFLDDSLSQYDDTRLINALDFLNEYSKNNQIILFTCHGFISDSAKAKNITVYKPFKLSEV